MATGTKVVPDTHQDILTKTGFAHLATIGPAGEPQSHPVWYAWQDDELLISTTKDRQKYRNLKGEKRVAASITDPDNPYRYVEIRGRVTTMEDDPNMEFIDSLAQRYMNKDKYPYTQPGDQRVIIHIRPEHAATMG
ncbi:MAG TPA: PPOX class F420-dependent oxidoreductase [Acidimicrobiales bacterium]|nr:PPOX class F420-dependent oxidoreductase [Acidimicrobiales bacterium]